MRADSGLETKFCRPDTALVLDQTRPGAVRITGYASIFGLKDQGGDVVQPGAYAKSLARLRAAGGTVRMLWQYDPAQPIGVWDEVREDQKGLWVSGRILTDVDRGREAAALIGAGAMDGLSIGYRTVTAEKDAKGRRLLRELELWEVSLVTFPMLPEARVAAKADAGLARTLTELASALAEARRTWAAADRKTD